MFCLLTLYTIIFLQVDAARAFVRNILSIPPVHNSRHVYEDWYAQSILFKEDNQGIFDDPNDAIPNVPPYEYTQENPFTCPDPFTQLSPYRPDTSFQPEPTLQLTPPPPYSFDWSANADADKMVDLQPMQLSPINEEIPVHQSQPERDSMLKGDPVKPLKAVKVDWLNQNWFSDVVDQSQFPHVGPFDEYRLAHKDVLSLRPGNLIWDQTIDAYMSLLKLREDELRRNQLVRTKFYFMPCCFFQLLQLWYPAYSKLSTSQKNKYDISEVSPYFFNQGPQPELSSCDFAFFPVNHKNEHYFLLVLDVNNWRLVLIDPLYDDTSKNKLTTRYRGELDYMCDFVANALRIFSPDKKFPRKKFTCAIKVIRPKQKNGVDCGVYVMKYVDYAVQGIPFGDLDWTEEQAIIFRYRIAHELHKHRARDINFQRMNANVTTVS